jgi:hypothetical protein
LHDELWELMRREVQSQLAASRSAQEAS